MKIQSPKKTGTSLRSAHVNIVLIITIELVFSVSQILQATLQLGSARVCSFCCVYLQEACLREIQSLKMPRTAKILLTHDCPSNQEDSSPHEESSSKQEQDQDVFLQSSQAQLISNMFMPYVKGPKMDCTVNNGLYHRFLKWHLNVNILECELMMLSER